MSIACITFIGIIRSQPTSKFYDINLLNHLVIIAIYYFLYALLNDFHFTYFCLIFVFTYIFFILKDNGFGQSVTLWTYIQALMIATSFIEFPFSHKIAATMLAYIETQIVVYACFKLFPSNVEYMKEAFILNFDKLRQINWFNYQNNIPVKLAIRGSLSAGILYIICVSMVTNDLKPNWAAVVAVSCLMRDDDDGSKRSMISCAVGSLIGWGVSIIMIQYLAIDIRTAAIIAWITLILGLIFIFEFSISKTYLTQILSIVFLIISLSAMYIILKLDSKFYLHLKIINNIIGVVGTLIALEIWVKLKKS
ncbi:MAG: hypothetical protein KBD37_03945 [Burkholderiales bacterium]|nr:hypothetical protein [Burkholderiales bacterium]